MKNGVELQAARAGITQETPYESPAEFMQWLASERSEFAVPISQIENMIGRCVPSADAYPAVFQQFYEVTDKLPVAFPERLRDGVSAGMRELLGSALYTAAYHLEHASITESFVTLSKGSTLPVRLYGTQPLEDLYTFTQAMDRVHEVMTDPDVKTAAVVANADFHLYRFIDQKCPGAPAVQMYIRPRGGFQHDEHHEYGKSNGIRPSINVMIDTRPLNHVAHVPFIGEVTKRGRHAKSVLSVRADCDGYSPENWYERPGPSDPYLQEGTVSFDGGALFGRDRHDLRIGRIFAFGSELRSKTDGVPVYWNHVLSFSERDGDADVFSEAAEDLVAELDGRRMSPRALRRIYRSGRESARPILNGPIQSVRKNEAKSSVPSEVVRLDTADEVLEQTKRLRSLLTTEIQENTVLHHIIRKRVAGFDFSSKSDGPLLSRAADALSPFDRTKARWQMLSREKRELNDEERHYLTYFAGQLGMITTVEFHAAVAAIPNSSKQILAEGGANETSVIRRDNACQLVGNDPDAFVWQSGSGRHIPKYLYDGSINPEYVVVTSTKVAGMVLPPAPAYSEYQVNVASALSHDWKADIPASERMHETMRGVDEVAVLRSATKPDVRSIKPQPARYGRATIGMAVRALAASGILNDSEHLILPTTSQYVPKTTIQAARVLRAMGKGDMKVQAMGMPGLSSADAYLLETSVLCRLLSNE